MPDPFIDGPLIPPVSELHVWIAHFADRSEDILNAPIQFSGGLRHMALMGVTREAAERFASIAHGIQDEMRRTETPIVRVELRTFRAVTS